MAGRSTCLDERLLVKTLEETANSLDALTTEMGKIAEQVGRAVKIEKKLKTSILPLMQAFMKIQGIEKDTGE